MSKNKESQKASRVDNKAESVPIGEAKRQDSDTPRYHCPIHGDISEVIEIVKDHEVIGRFCIYCLNDFLIKNIGQVTKIKGGNKSKDKS